MTSEFIDAYSDDQIYLDMLEGLVNAHPSESTVPDHIKYSSFSRLWAVMMVGGVECMIKEWSRDESTMHDVYSYFDNVSNAERIEKLMKAFALRGVDADVEQFEIFLAVKYIRNAYVHGQWNESQRNYVATQGFPETLMSFDARHLEKMKFSYLHVMKCLGVAKCFNTVLSRRDA